MAFAPTILFWVQHLLGTGHLNRLLAVAGETARLGGRIIVVSGGPPVEFRIPSNVEFVQLPPILANDSTLKSIVQSNGEPVDDAHWRARQDRLNSLLLAEVPDVVVSEMFPFGRRKFRREVLQLIHASRSSNPNVRVFCSLRDVLVTQKRPKRSAEMAALAREHFHKILVHSDQRLLPLEQSFPHADDLKDLCVYTGFVVSVANKKHPERRRGVIVSAGGGIVGHRIIETALTTIAHNRLAHCSWTVVTGPRAANDNVRAWQNNLAPNLDVVRHIPQLGELIGRAKLSISQAGYNTVCETLLAGTPAILVPFETETEDEQLLRARVIAAHGHAQILREPDLTSQSLACAIDRAVAVRPSPQSLNFAGARNSAEVILSSVARST